MANIGTENIIRFVVLLLVQVLILNHINFLGYINPYCYILFIILYPINSNRMVFLFLSFLLGLLVDVFSDSGGIHAAACVLIAYIRPVFLKSTFGMLYEHQSAKFKDVALDTKLGYMAALIGIHALVLFSLEVFNISQILLILKKTLFSSIFTLILCLLITALFSRNT